MSLAVGRGRIGLRLVAVGVVASIVPDIDVLGRWIGIPGDGDFGHRGALHSLCFAALIGVVAALTATRLKATPRAAFAFVFLSCASHGLLDMLTDGGGGIEYLWPFSGRHLFLPWRPILASPLSVSRFLHASGAAVLRSEVRWVWLPSFALAFAVRLARRGS